MSALPQVATEPIPNPFKFLNFFTKDDSSVFAGRDAETRAVLAGISAGRTFVLYGPSGVGKSSLLLADVIPRLEKRGYQTIYLRVLDSPVGDLVKAVNEQLGIHADEETLAAELRGASAAKPIIIVFDQFEEFFTRFEEKKQLQRDLGMRLREIFAQPGAAVQVVFSLREDYFGPLGDLKNDLPDLFGQSFRLLHLTAFGSRQAIIAPLVKAGMTYDAELITLMVNDLAQDDFDPPILQILCTEIFKASQARKPGTHHLTTADFHKVGGSREIFPRYVQAATQVPGSAKRLIIFSVLDAMTTDRGTKMAMKLAELTGEKPTEPPVYFRATADDVLKAIEHLEERSIVRKLTADTFELLHDRLVPVVKKALEQDAEFNRFRNAKRFVAEFTKAMLSPDDPQRRTLVEGTAGQLMSVQQLEDLVQPYDTVLRLTQAETEFVLRSHMTGQTGQIRRWMTELDQFPTGDSEAVIRGALSAHDERIRAGAAFAVQQIASPRATTIKALTDLALTDPAPAVRQRACKALSHHSEAIDALRVRSSLRVRSVRSNALDLLSDLAAAEKTLPGMGVLTELRVAARLRKRVFFDARDSIRMGGAVGAAAGAVAGAVWMGTIGVVVYLLIQGLYAPAAMTDPRPTWLAEFAILVTIATVVSAVAGLLVGWRAGAREQKRKALQTRAGWLFQPTGGVVQFLSAGLIVFGLVVATAATPVGVPKVWNETAKLFLPFLVIVGVIPAVWRVISARRERLIAGHTLAGRLTVAAKPLLAVGIVTAALVLVHRWMTDRDTFVLVTFPVLAAGVVVLGAGPLIQWTKKCLDAANGAIAIGWWSFACAATAPLVPPLAVHAFMPVQGIAAWPRFIADDRGYLVTIAVLALSITAFAAAMTCGWLHVRRRTAEDATIAPTPLWPRAAAAVLSVAVAVFTAMMFIKNTPYFLDDEPLGLGKPTSFKGVVGIGHPTSYHGLEVTGEGPVVVRAQYRSNGGLIFFTAGQITDGRGNDSFLAFGGQQIRLAALYYKSHRYAVGDARSTRRPAEPYSVHLMSQPLVIGEPRLVDVNDRVYAMYTLNRAEGNRFRGEVSAKVDRRRSGVRPVAQLRIIAAGVGQDAADWFKITYVPTYSGRADRYEDYGFTDTAVTDTMMTTTDVYSATFAEVEYSRQAEPRGILRYAHPADGPWYIGGEDVTSLAVADRVTMPLTIARVIGSNGERTQTPWWGANVDAVTVLVEWSLRAPTEVEVLAEGARLLRESRYSYRMASRDAAEEYFRALLATPSGRQKAIEYMIGLVLNDRNDDAQDLGDILVRIRRGDGELWDALAHALYARGKWTEAAKAWDRAEELGFLFYSPLCTSVADQENRSLARQRAAGAAPPP